MVSTMSNISYIQCYAHIPKHQQIFVTLIDVTRSKDSSGYQDGMGGGVGDGLSDVKKEREWSIIKKEAQTQEGEETFQSSF